ncbi:MAG: response regulator transcription factor [Alphaproteobacteria bacterium]|nr:response regulator transcription factor [Alphaproteobacteria bacterium]
MIQTTEKKHILVIDDDNRLRQLLHKYLSQNDFFVSEAENPVQARQLMEDFTFDLFVVDVMMPLENGLEFTKWLRENKIFTPVLMLTAMGDVQNRIDGFEAGVDDYLPKPFEPKELLLRIYSILRRTEMILEKQRLNQLRFGNCLYDIERQELSKDGEFIALTPVESELMHLLVSQIGCEVSREELARLTKTENERTIDVQVNRLRKKIEEEPKKPRYLQTVRGKGYLLLAD